MKIIELHIRGFRSLYNVIWKPADLNVVIGPNGSGKSNLLKALEMLSVSARGGLSRQVLREGGMEPLVWDGLTPSIQFRLRSTPLDAYRDPVRESLTYDLTLERLGTSSAYTIAHEILGNFYLYERGEKPHPLKTLERTSDMAVVFDEKEQSLSAPQESVPPEESLLSAAAGPFTANRLISAYQVWLGNWQVYQNFQTHQEAAVRQPAIARMETAIAPDGSNLVQVLHTLYTTSRAFKHELNLSMKAAFGDDFEELTFPPAADQRVQLRVGWKSLSRLQSTADLSDGTLRFLYLIAILANPRPPALIAIDEPETGLHPSMLPIIAEYAVEASRRTQIIITTHSAEFLDSFHDVIPTTTVIRCEDGQTQMDVVAGDTLVYWLKEYTLGKLFRSGELESMT